MSKLIFVLLVVTSSFHICLADTPTLEEDNEDEVQTFDEISDEWSSYSYASSSASSSTSSSSSSQTQTSECGPPDIPTCENPNEVYDPCDAPCPARRCDFDPTVVRCKAPPKVGDEDCLVGCRCIDGYARNDAGVCIPRDQCPPKQPQCGPNEVYDPCPDCSPQTCETMNKSYHCPATPASKTGPRCKPSCRCQKGYYRNKIGECIAASDCLKCTKPHEYFSCGGACDNVCDTIKEQNQTNCPIVNIKCNEMCYCEKGYARDYKNDCIPINDCPTCPTNERYDPCPATLCTVQSCDQAGFPLNCTPREEGCPCPGKPGCICKDGYLRNNKGKCVPSSECPSCGGDKNATLGCGVNCNRHCADLNQKPRSCILICYPNSCDCRTDKNGNKYYYDANTNKCVLPQDCTPTCKANEEYSECINGGCSPRNCSQLGKPVPCPKLRPEDCIKGCICKSGYLRAENGTCIPEKQCPSCGDDPNAESGCGTFCETCANYKKGPVACPDICQINGCQCKKGYIYDQNRKKCVLPKQCTPTCKANEVYSDCINGGCEPRNCSQLGYPVPCVKLNVDACIEGCICAPGYLRAKNGTCIPEKQCPSCGGDPNAESGCGVFCDRCTGPIPCPKICKINGCQCKKGHVYDDNTKKCVLPKDCTPKCGTNEEFDPCPDCSPQTCETMNKTYHCPVRPANQSGPNCKPSCRCIKGFFRNKIGQCIAARDCLKCTKPHEYFSCGGACDNVCATLKEQNQTHCPIFNIKCNEMCYCESGYARDYKNNCVLIKDCPIALCPKQNEIYDSCPLACPPRKCGIDDRAVLCLADQPCLPAGCRCQDGYYRNDDGLCVTWEECPTCENPNEVYDPCDAPCPARRCDFDATVVRCKPPPKVGDEDCLVGCRCIDGYARNDAGVCIPRDQCPPKQPQCGPNEVYDPCPDCSPQTCETMNKSYHCPATPASKTGLRCKPSCRCQKGYYRNKIGECIAASDCLKCTKPHEYFSCGGACDNVCDTIKEQNQTNCPIVNIKCNEMCYCEKGYARDYKNDCIPINDCPTCPTNERYDPCPATLCTAQNCDQVGFPLNCTQTEEGCPCPGKPGCVCKDGYLRNNKGKCVPSSECPSCGGDKNATLGCGVNCNRHCSDLNQKPRPCILICYLNSCDCKTDKNGNKYYYDDNTKKCVLPQDCTPTCKANEEYSECINGGCSPRNCSQLGKPVPCPKLRPDDCIKGCICKSGYLRAENGTCIPEKDCPSCGDDPNAESGCGTFCETCANYKKGPVACPAVCQINGCQCKKGYIYDQNRKKCVLPKQCTPTCKANEVYSDCINGGCEPRNCSQLGYPVPCVKLNVGACIEGCICAPGYLRAKNGTCIPQKQCPSCGGDPNAESGCGVFCDRCTGPIPCPKICKINGCQCKRGHVYDDNTKKCVLPKDCTPNCGTNEEFDPCPDCSPQTCETMNNTYHCVRPADKSVTYCKPSCRCKKGFFRNKIGQCIAARDCLKCTKPHEYFSCGSACDNVCATLKERNQTHCPIVNKKCNEMCYCESGYARDYKNNCVLIKDCPTQCGVNERYVECPTSLCVPQTCDQLGKPIACPRIIPGRCPDKPACVCIEGYVRNSKGVCIPKCQCPSCGGDENAQSGCGFLCSEQCGRTKPAPEDCPCEINGCVCKPGYIYDNQQNKCVKRGQCSPQCCENEMYTSCANGGCDKWNCTQYYEPELCIDPIECFGGCICKKDYLRAPNGTCIQQDQCPIVLCPKQNEIYDSCPLACPPRKCGIDDRAVLCLADQPCLPAGCRCQDGYYRNNDGICVTWEECDEECE